ncbi:hypothetical protein HY045_03905 [Candidatus Woesebacteria bacterium]|nr:hypothetical protein [Candidatus Woesebacteria bacterium]
MAKITRDLVIYIERKQMTFFGGGLEKVIKLPLEKELYCDLEVVDRALLVEEISKVIQLSRSPAYLNVIFSDSASFFKDLDSGLIPERLEEEEKKFRDLVPFDEVAIALVKVGQGYKVIGVNWEIYRVVVEAISSKGFVPLSVVPELAVPGFNQKGGLNEKSGLLVVQKQKSLKQNNFSTSIEVNEKLIGKRDIKSLIKNIKPVTVLVGVFTLLVTILVFLILKSF